MYEAQRWHDDPVFHALMIICENGSQVFAGDIVNLKHKDVLFAKMTKLFKQVSSIQYHINIYFTYTHINLLLVLDSLQKASGKLAANALLTVRVEFTSNDYVVLGTEADVAVEEIVKVVTDHHPFVKEQTYSKPSPYESPVPLSDHVCHYMNTRLK